jgi:hypothetical protein
MPLQAHRARRVAALIAGLLVVGALAAALVLPGSGRPAAGCVDATVASTTGGAAIHACGLQAARLCATPQPDAAVRAACRRAGRPVADPRSP